MASHHHDDHHSEEKKPVSFNVPFIMGVATLIILLMFLSLCDPKKHEAGGHGEAATEATHEGHGETKAAEAAVVAEPGAPVVSDSTAKVDTSKAQVAAPAAEPAHDGHAH